MASPTTSLGPALVLVYLSWRVYRRFHRNVGRQLLHSGRLVTGVVIFGLFAVALLIEAVLIPRVGMEVGGGLVLGGLLALVGLRLTKFEIGETAPHYYTPNTYIGVGISLLLVGRVVYRLGALYCFNPEIRGSSPLLMQSPFTLFLFALTAGYYVAFNSGVLIRARR